MARTGSRRRGGWRQQGKRIQVYVRLHAGTGGLRTHPFPLATPASELQAWIDDQITDYRKRHPAGEPGTLSADVAKYLKLLVNRPALQSARAKQLAWWCDAFGHRSRWSLKPIDLETKLNELLASGKAASTVKKYRTALFNLYTKLDGRNASNPMRDVPPPREPEGLPRALPYTIIDQILAHLPEHRYARALTQQQATAIRFRLRTETNVSAIAKDYGVSETMIRKIRDRRDKARRDRPSMSRAVLETMASLGWSPSMIRAFNIAAGDYDVSTGTILARGRKKGGGSRAVRQKLTPDGVRAIELLVAAATARGGAITFSTSAVLRMWRRAIARLCATLDKDAATKAIGAQLRLQLAERTPYDLRHSFLTEMQLATGNIHATQASAVHADARMTHRYTLAAVSPELVSAATALSARLAAQRARNEPSNESRREMMNVGGIDAKIDRGRSTRSAAKQTAKARKTS